MDADCLKGLLLDFADCAKVLDRGEADQCAQLCEIVKASLLARAKSFVLSAQGSAVLMSYQSDSTPLLAQATFTARHSSGQTVTRRAGRSLELLLERVFLKTISPTGEHLITSFFRDPLPLDKGKGSWQCFSVACDHFPMLKKLGHRGISISHYCFDRALYSALARLMRQRHCLYHDLMASSSGGGVGLEALSDLTDWVVSTGCANHDGQNALKWGLAGLDCGEEVHKKLYIVVESLRNYYDLLQRYLLAFLTQSLTLVEDVAHRGFSQEFWASLCVEPVVLQDLVELGLRWCDGRLQVYESAASSPDFMEKVTASILSVFRFKKFTDSRWCTIGESCRSIVAGLAIGLQGLVQMIRQDPKASDYYIKGFENLDRGARTYAVIASLVSNICDSFLYSLLEDDRVCLKVEELEGLVAEEMEWLSDLSQQVWQDFAELVSDVYPQDLRSWSLQSASIIQAYITQKVFRVARSLPWSLTFGDVEANVTALLEQEGPLDSTSAKVRDLVKQGYPVHRVVAGVRLMAEVHWTSTSVEQGHGSASALHKMHKQYGANMLCMRSMLHMSRFLLLGTDDTDHFDASLGKREAALVAKQPQKLSARQAFLADLTANLKSASADGAITKAQYRELWSKHASYFAALTPEAKLKYQHQAMVLQHSKEHQTSDELQGLRAFRHLRGARDLEAQQSKQALFRLSNCRLTSADLEAMALLWGSEAFTGARLKALRDKAMLSPEAPSPAIVQALIAIDVSKDIQKADSPRPWVATLCRLRDYFRECGLLLRKAGQADRAYAFLFATQSPMVAELLPLQRFTCCAPPSLSGLEALAALNHYQEYTFTWEPGTCINAMDVVFDEHTEVLVLPYLGFQAGFTMASHSVPLGILEFVRVAMKAGAQPTPKAESCRPPSVNTELLEQYPWLSAYMSKPGSFSKASGSKATVGEVEPHSLGLDDDATEAAYW